jgi:hypothetical protein
VAVWIDNNHNSVLDAGDSQTTTNPDGSFTLNKVLPGPASILVVPTSAYRGTPFATTANPGATVTSLKIPLTALPGTVSGTVFVDADANGTLNGNEKGKSDVTVFLDLDGDGLFNHADPSTHTDPNGKYTFLNVAPATFQIGVLNTPGFISSPLILNLSAGQTASGQNVGLRPQLQLNQSPNTYTTGTPAIRVTYNTNIPPLGMLDYTPGDVAILTVRIAGRKPKDQLTLVPEPGSPIKAVPGRYVSFNGTVIGRITTPQRGVTVQITFDPSLFSTLGYNALSGILNSVKFHTPRNRESNGTFVQVQLQLGSETIEASRKLSVVKFKK